MEFVGPKYCCLNLVNNIFLFKYFFSVETDIEMPKNNNTRRRPV